MSYSEKRNEVDQLQQKINSFGELSQEIKKKINYKFRLDWNYYSNSMEGNTLTLDETRSVMIGNLTVGGKPIKDVLEIKGHDDVITQILKIGKSEVRLSEARIKEIHKNIISEDDEDKKKLIGEWKTNNNHIINYKGEKFDFAPHPEVAERIHHLLNKTNAAIDAVQRNKKDAPHPLDIALEFHLEYLTIHPFYDGNGRTARILTNLLLISFGYPPFWIRTNERTIYNQYLADIQGYGGNADLFFEFAAQKVIRSQQLVLDAIEGKDIHEPEDLDKKIMLLAKELEAVNPDEEVKFKFSKEVFVDIYDTWFSDLVRKAVPDIQKFNQFFTGTTHSISLPGGQGNIQFVNESADEILAKLFADFEKNNQYFANAYPNRIALNSFYGTLIKGGLKTFGCNYSMEIKFEQIKYEVWVDEFSEDGERKPVQLFERLLHKPLTDTDIKQIVEKLTNAIYEHIDFYTKKSGLR